MEKKILFCASTISHIRNFHLPYLEALHGRGYETWVVADRQEAIPYADCVLALPFCKSFFSISNVKTIFNVRRVLKQERFDVISTHTTLASVIIRAAVLLLPTNERPRVFNTCHGYLFHEDEKIKKWIYLLPEKICASVTDVLMVMNHEDYGIAEKHHLFRDKLYYINGMGIDLSKFERISDENRVTQRENLGFKEEQLIYIYAAEFSNRKNHMFLIRAFAKVAVRAPQAVLILAGTGAQLDRCKALARDLNIGAQIYFMGHVDGMERLYPLCDVAISTGLIEGLPFNIMEAMACGLPVIASKIKGHLELIEEGQTGYLFEVDDLKALKERLMVLYNDRALSKQFGQRAAEKILNYSLESVKANIMEIYEES